MAVKPGKGSWFHIAIPSSVIVGDVRTRVQTLFLLFHTEAAGGGRIRNVHVYDGSGRLQEFNGLTLSGEHRLRLDGQNTFTLSGTDPPSSAPA